MSGIITELMKNGEVDKLIEGSKTNNQVRRGNTDVPLVIVTAGML